ncbi:TetR/AcrR family transcriptional regulator [Nocardioides sp.]|uniref:TetR/AcrR family transcriptional regulator n=1 Tax=Nocardioides sp. TaxID=35761 RepID=UPI003517F06F
MSEPLPATTRRRLSGAARAEQLLDTAEALFAVRGYAETSIEDIARAAGITRPIVYQRLGNKEAAYLAVVERVRRDLEDRVVVAAAARTDPRAQLAAGVDAFLAYLEDQPQRWTLLYGSSTITVGELGERLTDARFATVAMIRSLLAAHAEDGPAIEAFAHLVSGAVEQLGRWWRRHPEVPRAVLVEHALDLLWSGLAPHVRAAVPVESGGRDADGRGTLGP